MSQALKGQNVARKRERVSKHNTKMISMKPCKQNAWDGKESYAFTV